MSGIAIGLLVISASIHAGWNLVCKYQIPSQSFFLLASLAGVLLLLPGAIVYAGAIAQIPLGVWGALVLSGLCLAVYYVALAFVSNVSYLTAFRQLSIPIGTVLGRVLLQEPCPTPRLLGTAIILVGLILVSLG